MTAEVVTILKVEPGSTMSTTDRFFSWSGEASPGLFGSNDWTAGHGQDLPGLRPHHDHRGVLRFELRARRVQFRFDDILQAKINGQLDVTTIFGRTFLTTVGHQFFPGSVRLDITKAIRTLQKILHCTLNPHRSLVIVIHKPDHLRKHLPIRIDAHKILVEINSAQVCRHKEIP